MKRSRFVIAIILFFTFSLPASALASLGGKIDFSESRIVAVSINNKIDSQPWANGSGYLYSPRIVFSAGHLKDHLQGRTLYVSPPDKVLSSKLKPVKVIKILFPSNYKTKIYSNDFAILILEKPLANIPIANLATPEIISRAIAEKLPMKTTGYGVYEDICIAQKKNAPCSTNNDKTSRVPRSLEMMPWSADEIKEKYGNYDEEIADHIFLTSPYKTGSCPGDSGGSTTITIDGTVYYVGTVPSGTWNAYTCGMQSSNNADTLAYTAPVFKFTTLIAQAEKYIANHS